MTDDEPSAIGTPHFIAPESLLGDVYGLGATPSDRFADMAALDATLAARPLTWSAAEAAACHARRERVSAIPPRSDDLTRPERRPSRQPALRLSSAPPPMTSPRSPAP